MRRRCHGDEPWDAGNIRSSDTVEWWMFLMPEKKQRMRMPVLEWEGSAMNPSYFCTGHLSFDAFKFLCNSLEGVKIDSNEEAGLPSSRSTLQQSQGQACLKMLPAELLRTIFELLKVEDFMALGLCSQALWSHAIRWAKSGYVRWRNEYSWIDTPIICAGDKLQVLPQALRHILPKAIPDEITSEPDRPGQHDTRTKSQAKTWFDESVKSFERVPFPYDYSYPEAFLKQIKDANIPESLHLPMKTCLPTLSLEPGSKWFLRNLTNKEYIRMEAVVTSDDEATVSLPGHKWLTLDIILLWVISWRGDGRKKAWSWKKLESFRGFTDQELTDTWHDPTYGPLFMDFWPIWTGPWAGHNLDVVTEQRLDNDWEDRTECVKTLAPKMLRLFYGLSLSEEKDHQEYWEEAFRQDGDYWELEVMLYSSSWDGDESDGERVTHRMPQNAHGNSEASERDTG
ncbi:uncharacterized protein BKA55DRAFT_562280 [Fusarium redolens]|uniref:F-box domain-containing protein n=1 Tax=Fusarium redolens TaxID=48865 RepID=A0A9P9HMS3_FUSRE|nr:uncharacterized protein BKA55DRAFT_562280 [Fusarium redolens]KAH7259269.1 hypothetical protein BKA55DRAFT_562280 [Fusarium redolens]